MKKIIGLVIFLVFLSGMGFFIYSSNQNAVATIDGVLMISAKDAGNLLGLDYKMENGSISFKQDSIVLKIDLSSPCVYKDEYIMDLMEKTPVRKDDKVYLPMSFFNEYLNAKIMVDDRKQPYLSKGSHFSMYEAVKFLPAEVLSVINDKNYPNRDKIMKAVMLPGFLGVDVPRVDMDKIIDTRPLEHYAIEDLKQHGYTMYEIINFYFEDYKTIKNKWKLSAEQTEAARGLFPELKNQDIREWTNRDYRQYYSGKIKYFTNGQESQLIQGGIRAEDMALIYKFTAGDASLFLTGSDKTRKDILRTQYHNILNQIEVLANSYPSKKRTVQPEKRLAAKMIKDNLLISASDIERLLKTNFKSDKTGSLIFSEDNITIKLRANSNFIYNNDRIIGVLDAQPVIQNKTAYVPIEFVSGCLHVPLISVNDQIYIVNSGGFSLYNVAKFLPADVLSSITDKEYPYRDKLLKAIELPRSMNIEIPHINLERILDTNPLSIYKFDFPGELKKHGYSEAEIAGMSYGDYSAIESTWKLDREMIRSTKNMFPELKYENLSNWTYEDKASYAKNIGGEDPATYLTDSQKEQLKHRGVLPGEIRYLLKRFYQIDTILAQPDIVLKETISKAYQTDIDSLQ